MHLIYTLTGAFSTNVPFAHILHFMARDFSFLKNESVTWKSFVNVKFWSAVSDAERVEMNLSRAPAGDLEAF